MKMELLHKRLSCSEQSNLLKLLCDINRNSSADSFLRRGKSMKLCFVFDILFFDSIVVN